MLSVILWVSGAIVLMAISAYLSIYNSREEIICRHIKKTQEYRIPEVRTGQLVKIRGRVAVNKKTHQSPLTGEPCAYYHVLVEELRSRGKYETKRSTLISEKADGGILIRSDNDYAFIQMDWVKKHILPIKRYESTVFKKAPVEFENYLVQHGYASNMGWGLNKTIQCNEGLLREDEWVVAVGYGTWKKSKALGLTIPAEDVLVLDAHGKEWVYLSNDPKVLGTSR